MTVKSKILVVVSMVVMPLLVSYFIVFSSYDVEIDCQYDYVQQPDFILALGDKKNIDYFKAIIKKNPTIPVVRYMYGASERENSIIVALKHKRFDVARLLVQNGADWRDALSIIDNYSWIKPHKKTFIEIVKEVQRENLIYLELISSVP